jgi:rRNA-processing protein FCF1
MRTAWLGFVVSTEGGVVMPRVVVLDRTIFDQINQGNVDVAKRLKDLADAQTQIWITHYDYDQLTEADKAVMTEFHVRSLLQDNYVERYYSRGMLDPFQHRAGTVKEWRSPEATAALAFHLKAELMTMDKEFEQAFLKFGAVPGMRALRSVTGSVDYNRARRLLQLPPLAIGGPNGKILPRPKVGPGTPAKTIRSGGAVRYTVNNQVGVSYPPGRPLNTEYQWKNKKGDPIEAPKEYGPSPGGQAGFQMAATIGLQGVNWVIQEINDSIQKKRFNEAWARLAPQITSKLNEDPSQGVLIFVNYSRRIKQGAENDSPLDHVSVFQSIKYSFGYTPEDARVRSYSAPPDYRSPSGTGEEVITSEGWFPPKQPVDVTKLPTPFQKAGLATFVPGREKLVRVKFSGRWGFDDKMFSVAKLNVPAGMVPQFFYLFPPDEISYRDDDNVLRTVRFEVDFEHAAEAVDNELAYSVMTVIHLDSYINPYSATAAMVYPADNATANLFKTTAPTQDNLGYLKSYRMDLVRWVKTDNVRLLRSFWDQPSSP